MAKEVAHHQSNLENIGTMALNPHGDETGRGEPMRWRSKLIVKFVALSLLSLGACRNTGAPPISATRAAPDSTDEPPLKNGLPDLVKWLKSGNTMYWINNDACVEWSPSTVQNNPYRVMLRHEVRYLSRDLFIRKALLTFEFGGVSIDGNSEKHWVLQQGPSGPNWDLRGTTNTARTLVMQVAAVDNGRAVSVAGNTWWWFARREDCQRDIDFPPIHGFIVQPPLPKASVPWPRDPRRANQPSK